MVCILLDFFQMLCVNEHFYLHIIIHYAGNLAWLSLKVSLLELVHLNFVFFTFLIINL